MKPLSLNLCAAALGLILAGQAHAAELLTPASAHTPAGFSSMQDARAALAVQDQNGNTIHALSRIPSAIRNSSPTATAIGAVANISNVQNSWIQITQTVNGNVIAQATTGR